MMMSLLEGDNEDSEDSQSADSSNDGNPEVGTDSQIKGDTNVYRTETSNKGQGKKGEKSSDFKH